MSAFRSTADICRALADENLSTFESRILSTVKPAIDFARRQQDDRSAPAGISKMGGLPDLPAGFRWPTRPPVAAAAGISKTADRTGAVDPYDGLRAEALRRDFPLAFFAQLNLTMLSLEAGYDADLPEGGMLYIFEDITAGDEFEAYRLFWSDQPVAQLSRQSPPEDLILLSDAKDPSFRFAEQSMTEVLEPFSVLTVPFHWRRASGSSFGAMYDFLDAPSTDCFPQPQAVDGEAVGAFGDRLGGWPVPIQQDPEPSLRKDGSTSFAPGDDEIRLLFSWGGEYFANTQQMHSLLGGDGATYLMMPRDDLLAGRFQAAKAVYQST